MPYLHSVSILNTNAPLQCFITHRHQISSAERHSTKCLSLCNTKHISDTFWFLLQVCQNLLKAAKSGDVDTVRIFLKCTNDNCTTDDQYRNTPLIYAAGYGHVEVVRVLLEGGENVERANANKRTALHAAAWKGHLEVCRLLLDWGAKVDPLDRWNEIPLHDAAQQGHLSVAKLLLERGANVRMKKDDGYTPLHYAAKSGNISLVKLLLERGADVREKDNKGRTAREVARNSGQLDVVAWFDSVGHE